MLRTDSAGGLLQHVAAQLNDCIRADDKVRKLPVRKASLRNLYRLVQRRLLCIVCACATSEQDVHAG